MGFDTLCVPCAEFVEASSRTENFKHIRAESTTTYSSSHAFNYSSNASTLRCMVGDVWKKIVHPHFINSAQTVRFARGSHDQLYNECPNRFFCPWLVLHGRYVIYSICVKHPNSTGDTNRFLSRIRWLFRLHIFRRLPVFVVAKQQSGRFDGVYIRLGYEVLCNRIGYSRK